MSDDPERDVPERVTYWCECIDCEDWAAPDSLTEARGWCKGHVQSEDHETRVLRVVEWWSPPGKAE